MLIRLMERQKRFHLLDMSVLDEKRFWIKMSSTEWLRLRVRWISLLCLSIMQEMGRDRDCISPYAGHMLAAEHSLSSESRARKHNGLNMQNLQKPLMNKRHNEVLRCKSKLLWLLFWALEGELAKLSAFSLWPASKTETRAKAIGESNQEGVWVTTGPGPLSWNNPQWLLARGSYQHTI